MSKYNANKTKEFDSSMEKEFKELLDSRNISYEFQKKFLLQEGYEVNGVKGKEINYVADFYLDKLDVVIDIKGFSTSDFKLKKKMFEQRYNKELVLLTKCPKCYLGDNNEALFEGWIEIKLLNKLKTARKKANPKADVEKFRLPIRNGVMVSRNKLNELFVVILDEIMGEKESLELKRKLKNNYLITKI